MQRRKVSIDGLPTELLLGIINYVFVSGKRDTILNLCLVSRQFGDLACPLLLARISLGGFTSRLRDKSTQLKALSQGDTKAALAKHLSIDYSSSFDNDAGKVFTPLEKTMLKHLKSAVSSFRAITSVSWQIGQYEPSWLIDSIMGSLAAIPTIQEIKLRYLAYSSHVGNLDAFSNLRKISAQCNSRSSDRPMVLQVAKLLAQCPALTELDISAEADAIQLFQFVDQAGKSLSLQNLTLKDVTASPDFFSSAIQHLRSLQSLSLYRFWLNPTWPGPTIWDILIRERIYIRNLSTDALGDPFFRYLSSFQGLRNFSATIKYGNQLQRADVLQAIIPHHAESLAELDIVNLNFEETNLNPSFSEDLINLLSSFINLRCFSCQPQNILDAIPLLKYIIPTCSKIFPTLRRLIFHTPQMIYHHRYPLREFSLPFTRSIHEAITAHQFGELSVPSFEIECERVIYRPCKDEITGIYAYVA